MPNIKLAFAFPKTQAWFDNAVKTKVIAVRTSKEHASAMDHLLTQLFPASTAGQMYVSYLQGTDEMILKCP
jgi:hypothetical protein